MADITVGIRYQVDRAGLTKLQNDLSTIANINPNGKKNQAELNKAIKSAKQLQDVLNKAYNPSLGGVGLSKFSTELKKAGLSVKQLQADLNGAGPSGAKAFANIQSQLLRTNVAVKQQSALLNDLAHTFKNSFKYSMAYGAVDKVTSVIKNAVTYTKQLDKSLNDIRIVTDKSAESMQNFAKYANETAKALGSSTTDVTGAALIYYQQGLSDAESKARAETTIKAANVTGQTGQQVSEQLTSVWNGYKVTAAETEAYVDRLAAVAASSASDLEELSTAMSKVASAANMTGVDIDQLNATLSTVISVTRNAPETVGTAFKTIYARMGDLRLGKTLEDGVDLGSVSSQLAKVGIEVLDVNGEMRDMGAIVEDVGNKWNSGEWDTATKQALAIQLAGKRQYTQLAALFDNWDQYNAMLKVSQESTGTLQHQQEIYMQSISAKLETLKASWQDVYGDLIDEDELSNGISLLTSFVNTFDKFIEGSGGGLKTFATFGALISKVFNKQIANEINRIAVNARNAKDALSDAQTRKNLILQNKDDKVNRAAEVQGVNAQIGVLQSAGNLGRFDAETQNQIINQAGAVKDATQKRAEIEREITELETDQATIQYEIGELMSNNSDELQAQISQAERLGNEFRSAIMGEGLEDADAIFGDDDSTIKSQALKSAQQVSDLKAKGNTLSKEEEGLLKEHQNILRRIFAEQQAIVSSKITELEAGENLSEEDRGRLNVLRQQQEALRRNLRMQEDAVDSAKVEEAQQKAAAEAMIQTANAQARVAASTKFVTNSLTAVAFSISSIGSLVSTWGDDSLSFGEKLATTLESVAFMGPIIASSFAGIGKSLMDFADASKVVTVALNAETAATIADSDVTAINTILKEADGEMSLEEAVARAVNDKKITQETADLIVQNGVLETNTAEKGKNALVSKASFAKMGEGLKGMLSAVGKFLASPIGLAIGGITVAVGAAVVAWKAYNAELNEAKGRLKSTSEAITDLKEMQSALGTSLDALAEKQKKLNSLTKGTSEWSDALLDVNNQIREILQQYPELAKYVITTSSGQLKLDESGVEQYQEKMRDSLLNAQIMQNKASKDVFEAQKDHDINNILGFGEEEERAYDELLTAFKSGADNDRLQEILDSYNIDASLTRVIQLLQEDVAFNKSNKVLDESTFIQKAGEKGINLGENSGLIASAMKPEIEAIASELKKNYLLEAAGPAGFKELTKKYSEMMYGSSEYVIGGGKLDLDGNGEADKDNENLTREEMAAALAEVDATDQILDEIANGSNNIVNAINNASFNNPTEFGNGKTIGGNLGKAISEAVFTGEISEDTLSNDSKNKLIELFKDTDEETFKSWSSDEQFKNLATILNVSEESLRELGKTPEEIRSAIISGCESGANSFKNAFKDGAYGSDKSSQKTGSFLTSSEEKEALEGTDTDKVNKQIDKSINSKDTTVKVDGQEKNLKQLDEEIKKNSDDAKEVAKLNNAKKKLNETTKDAVAMNARYNKGINESANILKKDNKEILNSQSNINKLNKAVAKVFNLEEDFQFSDDFWNDENLENYRKGIEGNEEAWTQFRYAAQQDIVSNLQINNSDLNYSYQAFQEMANIINNAEIGNTIKITADTEEAIRNIILAKQAAGASLEEIENAVNEFAGTLGLKATLDPSKSVSIPVPVPTVKNGELSSKTITVDVPGFSFVKTSGNHNYLGGKTSTTPPGGGGGSGGGGGGGSKGSKKDRIEKPDYDRDPYYQTDRALEKVGHTLENLNKLQDKAFGKERVQNLKRQNAQLREQAKLYKQQSKIAQSELKKADKEAKASGFKIGRDGRITNYESNLRKLEAQAEAARKKYNAHRTDKNQKAFEKAQERYEKALAAADKVTEALNNVYAKAEAYQDAIDQQIANNFEALSYQIEIRLDLESAQRDWADFKANVLDLSLKASMSDAYRDANAASLRLSLDPAQVQAAMTDLQKSQSIVNGMLVNGYVANYGDDMATAMEQLQENLDTAKEKFEQMREDIVALLEAEGAAVEELADAQRKFADELDRTADLYDRVAELYETVNPTDYNNTATAKWAASGARLESMTYNQDLANSYWNQYQAMLVKANNARSDLEKAELLKEADILRENYEAAVDAGSDAGLSAIASAKEALEKAVYEAFDNAYKDWTGGLGMDAAKQQWEWDTEDFDGFFLDSFNRMVGLEELSSKINASIADSDSIAVKQKLIDLQNGYVKGLEEAKDITQTELDIANAMYELALKEAAFEEAQKNKSKMQLRRDAQGNYSYQFVADKDRINDAQNEMLEAQKNVYNLMKQNTKEQEEYINELMEQLREFAVNWDELDEETQNRITERFQNQIERIRNSGERNLQDFSSYVETLGQDIADNVGDWLSSPILGIYEAMKESGVEDLINNFSESAQKVNNIKGLVTATLDLDAGAGAVVVDIGKRQELIQQDLDSRIDTQTQVLEEIRDMVSQIPWEQFNQFANALSSAGGSALNTWDRAVNQGAKTKGQAGANVMISTGAKSGNSTYRGYQGYTTGASNSGKFEVRDAMGNLLGWYKLDDLVTLASGGYTGSWGDTGKLAMLHEKELVLNANDTSNILAAVEMMRDLNAYGLGALGRFGNNISNNSALGIDQNVTIQANFPNVNNKAEIEQAFSNLVNMASQRAYKNR